MRQPEVVRVAGFLLALLLVLPVAHAGWSMLRAGAFLVEFLSHGVHHALSELTPRPTRQRLPVPGARVDRYLPSTGLARGAPLVLVHGFTPEGKNDVRVRHAAALLARAGFDVAVPTIPGLTVGRLRPDDVAVVVATLAARERPTAVVAVSVGAGPALLAAADPRVRERVRVVVSLGGYASALELLRFYLTGDYAYGDLRGHVAHDPEVVQAFIAANRDLIDDSARRLLVAGDRQHLDAAVAELSPALRSLLDALSPERVARDIRARLILIHGRADPTVPYTETLRLAAARPERTTVALVGVVAHVEGARGWASVRDLLTLLGVTYGLIAGS